MEKYKYSGKTLRIKDGSGMLYSGNDASGKEFVAEDYWININGISWMYSNGIPACLEYAMRTGLNRNYAVPIDDKVIYGKIGMIGHLFHESELELIEEE